MDCRAWPSSGQRRDRCRGHLRQAGRQRAGSLSHQPNRHRPGRTPARRPANPSRDLARRDRPRLPRTALGGTPAWPSGGARPFGSIRHPVGTRPFGVGAAGVDSAAADCLRTNAPAKRREHHPIETVHANPLPRRVAGASSGDGDGCTSQARELHRHARRQRRHRVETGRRLRLADGERNGTGSLQGRPAVRRENHHNRLRRVAGGAGRHQKNNDLEAGLPNTRDLQSDHRAGSHPHHPER